MNRRNFLQQVGGVAVAGTIRVPWLEGHPLDKSFQAGPRPRIAVLWEPGLPTVDAPAVSRQVLDEALGGADISFPTVEEFSRPGATEALDLVITPYGSAFPRAAFDALVAHLARGGHWINLGGAPCAVPVVKSGGAWTQETRQTSLHRRFGITQSFAVAARDIRPWQASDSCPWARPLVEAMAPSTVHELYVRFTAEKDFPDEDGSAGPRDAAIHAIAYGLDAKGTRRVAPFVAVDRLLGEFAGGRWVFATSDAEVDAPGLRLLVAHALAGSQSLSARPSYACVKGGEVPSLTVTFRRPGATSSDPGTIACKVRVTDERGSSVFEAAMTLAGSGAVIEDSCEVIGPSAGRLQPGLYHVDVESSSAQTPAPALRASTGFWMHDAALLGGGRPLGVAKTILTRGGKPFPVTGTTYMASDVQRKFLLEPNPHVWDRDFAAMKAAGVNLVRTGIWTGWKLHMPEAGVPDEGVLRAIDAFMLTARRHDIPVIFTFFAFLPEAWGGSNPYLDPRAVQAQKSFVTAIVSRFRSMPDVAWDLINEPSFSSSALLWFTRPNGDAHEARAWRDWLRARYPAASAEEHEAGLQHLWRLAPGEPLGLPSPDDFDDVGVFGKRRPLKAADYRLFAQEMFRAWAKEMTATVRAAGGRGQLVMVGQDEGGTYERPSNRFLAPIVDLTSVHTWWLNDDLLWDSVMTRTPGAPNLVQETGVMFAERADGRPWRTEEQVRDLLERKLALAIGAGGAGYVQWLWHSNCYMPSDNEAAIGLLRADGTAKPELDAWRGMTAFVASITPWFVDREAEPVLMLVPEENLFSVRNVATDATRQAVRVMHYHCRVPMGAVGSADLAARKDDAPVPALLVIPSPQMIDVATWKAALALAERGAVVAVTGPFASDAHGRPVSSMAALGLDPATRPVAQEEHLVIDGAEYRLSFRGEKMQRVGCSVTGSATPGIRRIPAGKGQVVWSPVPIELAQQEEPVAAFYRDCLKAAGVQPIVRAATDASILIYPAVYREAVLFTIVSEAARDTIVRFAPAPAGPAIQLTVGGGRAALVLVERKSGKTLAQYPEP